MGGSSRQVGGELRATRKGEEKGREGGDDLLHFDGKRAINRWSSGTKENSKAPPRLGISKVIPEGDGILGERWKLY